MHGALRPEQGAHKVFDASEEMTAAGKNAKDGLATILTKRRLTDQVKARENRIIDEFNKNLTRRAMQHIKSMAVTQLRETLSAHKFFEREHAALPPIPNSVEIVDIPMEQRLIQMCVMLLKTFQEEAKTKRTLPPVGSTKTKRRKTDKA